MQLLLLLLLLLLLSSPLFHSYTTFTTRLLWGIFAARGVDSSFFLLSLICTLERAGASSPLTFAILILHLPELFPVAAQHTWVCVLFHAPCAEERICGRQLRQLSPCWLPYMHSPAPAALLRRRLGVC